VRPNQQNNNAGKPADLGMKPRVPTPPAQPAIPPAGTPPQPVTAVPPVPQSVAQPPQVQPAVTPPTQGGTGSGIDFSGQVQTQTVGNAEVVKMNFDNTPPEKGSGPNTLTISIQPGAIGAGDKQAVSSVLGLTDQEIMSNCYFLYDAVVSTSGANDYLALKSNTSWRYNYSGTLTAVDLTPTIACRKLRAPISGTVVEENNLYQVPVGTVTCSPGAKGAAQSVALTVRYAGDGNGQCAF
jgi:hypothetical protein